MSWPAVPIGDLVKIRGGGTPQRSNEAFFRGDIPWVTPKDMKTWEIDDAQIKITREAIEQSAANEVPKDTVLLVVRSGVLKHTAPIAINRCPVAINQDMKSLQCNGRLLPEYLARFLKDAEPIILSWVRATTADNYSIDKIRELTIPLPPLDEQRRIATILDQADDLRRKRREAIQRLKQLQESAFVAEFDDTSAHPKLPLSQACSLITDGTHYTPTYADEGVIFLSAKNVTSGKIDWDDVRYIPKTLHAELQKRISPKRDDILLAKNGTTGVAAIVDRDVFFDIYVSLALLRAGPAIIAPFLLAAVNSPSATKQFRSSLKGIGVPNLHLKDIRAAIIPVPALELQRAFAARIAEVDKLKAHHHAQLAKLDALFASLQHRAFRGEL